MLFWIVLAAIVLVAGWNAYRYGTEYYGGFDFVAAGLGFLMSLIFGSLAGLGVMVAGAFASHLLGDPGFTGETRASTYNLRAVNTGSSVSGSFFLGSGTFEGKRTFSYVYEQDGWTRLGQVDASESRVAEDATPETAHMVSTTTDYYIRWYAPWNLMDKTTHDFHVPAGSVIETYEVSAK